MIEVSLLLSLLAQAAGLTADAPGLGAEAASEQQVPDQPLSLEDALQAGELLFLTNKVPATKLRHGLRDAVAREVGEQPQIARRIATRARDLPATLQLAVIEGLGRSAVPAALPALAAMSRESVGLQSFTLESLTRLARKVGGPYGQDVYGAVRHAMLVGAPEERRLAAVAAGVLRDDEAIPALIAMLDTGDALSAGAAHRALMEHTGIGYAASPSLWERWYRDELEFLEEQFDGQVQALRSAGAARRVQAVKAISAGRLGRDIRAAALIEFFPGVEDEALQLQILSSLRTLNSTRALPLLRAVLQQQYSEPVRAAATRVLASFGKPTDERSPR